MSPFRMVTITMTLFFFFSITTAEARNVKQVQTISHVRALLGSTGYNSLCQGIDHPRACMAVAKQFQSGDISQLAQDMLKEAMEKVVDATKLALKLQGKVHDKGSTRYELLDVCRTNFESMSDDIKDAMESLKGGNEEPIKNSLSALSTYLETCTDAYDETPEVSSPFDKTIRPMKDLVDNLFYMTEKMEKP